MLIRHLVNSQKKLPFVHVHELLFLDNYYVVSGITTMTNSMQNSIII